VGIFLYKEWTIQPTIVSRWQTKMLSGAIQPTNDLKEIGTCILLKPKFNQEVKIQVHFYLF